MNDGAGADEFAFLSYDNIRAFATGGEGRDEFTAYGFRLTSPGSCTADRIMDFAAGSGGDLLIAQSFSLLGWDGVVNPFAGGWLRFEAADVDSDGMADDLVLQGDHDRSGVAHTWQTVIELVDVDLADLVASNFRINNRSYSFTGGNALPEAFNDTYTVSEDGTLTVLASGVLANDFDPESAAMTAVLNSGPIFGTLTLNANGSFTYTPNANFSGTDSFTYRANDGANNGNAATVTINVLPLNDQPNASNDGYSVTEGQTLTRNALQGVRANDSDPDGDALSISLLTNVSNGTLNLAADGSSETLVMKLVDGDGDVQEVRIDNAVVAFVAAGGTLGIPGLPSTPLPGANVVPGTSGADNLLGTIGIDWIDGGDGADMIIARAGNDTINGA